MLTGNIFISRLQDLPETLLHIRPSTEDLCILLDEVDGGCRTDVSLRGATFAPPCPTKRVQDVPSSQPRAYLGAVFAQEWQRPRSEG